VQERKVISIENRKKDEIKETMDCLIGEIEISCRTRPSERMIKFYNFFGRIPRIISIPILLLTSIDAWYVLFLAGFLKRTDAALQVIYSYKARPWRLIWALGDYLWQGAYNCRSVRARGKFTKEAISSILSNFGNDAKVASLGSGSARQLLDAFSEKNIPAQIILVDYDKKALKRARKIADRKNIFSVSCLNLHISRYLREVEDETLNVVESVGIFDYVPDKHLRSWIKQIEKKLQKGGYFIGANISSKEEADYAHGAVCWPSMEYRSEEGIRKILVESNFKNIWTGKVGLYTVWIAKKPLFF